MALQKATVRTLVRQWADDTDIALWDNANLDLAIQLTLDDLWGDLLTHSAYLTTQLDTVTPTSPGTIDLRTVADGGDLSERFFRLQSLTRNGQEYREASLRDITIEGNVVKAANDSAAQYTYVILGDLIYLFPLETSPNVEIRYSYLPAAFNGLTESGEVVWPTGFEMAFILEAAGRAMLKGAREDPAQLFALARDSHQRLKDVISSRRVGGRLPFINSDSLEWGGE